MQGDARASVRVDPRSRALRRCSMPRRELLLRLARAISSLYLGRALPFAGALAGAGAACLSCSRWHA